jgi:hypothetical protein
MFSLAKASLLKTEFLSLLCIFTLQRAEELMHFFQTAGLAFLSNSRSFFEKRT